MKLFFDTSENHEGKKFFKWDLIQILKLSIFLQIILFMAALAAVLKACGAVPREERWTDANSPDY
jgi:hypothetical protein